MTSGLTLLIPHRMAMFFSLAMHMSIICFTALPSSVCSSKLPSPVITKSLFMIYSSNYIRSATKSIPGTVLALLPNNAIIAATAPPAAPVPGMFATFSKRCSS